MLRGPFSALYGNSSGGVISLISAAQKTRALTLGLDAGSDGLQQWRIVVETPLEGGFSLHDVLARTVGRLTSVDVYGRLVDLFEALAIIETGRRVVPGPLSQARIAERVGASLAMITRLVHDLVQGGYIQVSRERIVVLKEPPRWSPRAAAHVGRRFTIEQ